MKTKAKRTLVKSAPELWELADDLARMEAWMAGIVDGSESIPVEVTNREPERALAWRTGDASGTQTRIALELAESGFGTRVSLVAHHSRRDRDGVDAALEQVLDELGSPVRQPFVGR
jgi:hypothetical protein